MRALPRYSFGALRVGLFPLKKNQNFRYVPSRGYSMTKCGSGMVVVVVLKLFITIRMMTLLLQGVDKM